MNIEFHTQSLKRKFLIGLVLGFTTLVTQPLLAQEYKAFSVLGTSEAVCKPGIQTREELQSFFANDSETVRAILQDANWEGDPNLLFEAIAAGNFSERFYDKGTKFQWTGVRKKSGPKALPYRVWAGEEPFKGFEANIVSGCNIHQIVIPHACCNVSLASTTSVEVPAPQITVRSVNEQVTVCSDTGSEVVITDATGANQTVPLDANGCWTGNIAPGNMNAAVVNENECGIAASDANYLVVAAPAPAPAAIVEAPVAKAPGLIPYVGAFAGFETRMRYEPAWDKYYEDDVDVVGVKAGLIKPMSEAWYLFAQIGYLDRDGISDRLVFSDDTIFLDVGADRNIGSNGFIGGGIGYWNAADTDFDDVSLFVHGGIGLGSSNFQIFGEGRLFGEELDDIENNHMVTGGVRYLFK